MRGSFWLPFSDVNTIPNFAGASIMKFNTQFQGRVGGLRFRASDSTGLGFWAPRSLNPTP